MASAKMVYYPTLGLRVFVCGNPTKKHGPVKLNKRSPNLKIGDVKTCPYCQTPCHIEKVQVVK